MSDVVIHSDQVIKIGRLQPYVNNPRSHSEEQILTLMGLIQEFGFTNPVLIDEEFKIIAGHGRLVAAERLGMNTVPFVMVRDLTQAQKRAYIIADNKSQEKSSWDNTLLASEFNFLYENNFDVSLLGFAEDEAAYFLNGQALDDALPAVEAAEPSNQQEPPEHQDATLQTFSIKLEPDDKARLLDAIRFRKDHQRCESDAEAFLSLLNFA